MSRLLTDAEIAELRLEHNDGGGIGVCMACHAAVAVTEVMRTELRTQHVALFRAQNICRVCTQVMADGSLLRVPLPCPPLLILDALEATEGALATLRDLVRRIGPQIIAWGDLVDECLWCHARAEDTLMSVEHEPDCPWVVIEGMLEK